MNKNLKKLLACALLTFASSSATQAETKVIGSDVGLSSIRMPSYNRDGLMQGSGVVGAAMENAEREDAFGGCFQVMTGFNWMSEGDLGAARLGKAFGLDGKNSITIKDKNPANSSSDVIDTSTIIAMWYPRDASAGTVFNPFISGGGSRGETTVKFAPKHKSVFLDIGYCHDLSNFYDGLYFHASTKFEWVDHSLGLSYDEPTQIKTSTDVSGVTSSANNQEMIDALGSVSVDNVAKLNNGLSPRGFFEGSSPTSANEFNAQAPLKAGKFGSEKSQAGCDGVDLRLGYRIIKTENFCGKVEVLGLLPLGPETKTEYIFSPRVGQRNFKMGLGARAHACLAEGVDYRASLDLDANWQYAFGRNGKRLPHSAESGCMIYALSYAGTATEFKPAPFVNYFNEDTAISIKEVPGHSFVVNAGLSVEKSCFNGGISYSFSYDSLTKNEITGFDENKYFLVGDKFTKVAYTNKHASNTFATTVTGVRAVALKDLNLQDQSRISHAFRVNLGMVCREWQYPSFVSIFGSYNGNFDNFRVPRYWTVGLRGGMCF